MGPAFVAIRLKVLSSYTLYFARVERLECRRFSRHHDNNLRLFVVGSQPLFLTLALRSLSHSVLRTGGETRTPSQRFWRPLLYQLSYTRIQVLVTGSIFRFCFNLHQRFQLPNCLLLLNRCVPTVGPGRTPA